MAFSRGCLACAYILLVLSTHPIRAARTYQATEVAEKLDSAMQFARDLQAEMREGLHRGGQGAAAHGNRSLDAYIGESWASCSQRRDDFERRAGEVKARLGEAMKDGKVGNLAATRVFFKARLLVKTMSMAEKKGCRWAFERDVNMSVLEELQRETVPESPCYGAAQSKLKAVEGASAEERQHAGTEARDLFVNCLPYKVRWPLQRQLARDPSIDALEAEVDEEAEELADGVVELKSDQLAGGVNASLLQREGDEVTTATFLIFLGFFLLFLFQIGLILEVTIVLVGLALYLLSCFWSWITDLGR